MNETQPFVIVVVVAHMLPWRERGRKLLVFLFLVSCNHPTVLALANTTRSHLSSSLRHSLNGRAATLQDMTKNKAGEGGGRDLRATGSKSCPNFLNKEMVSSLQTKMNRGKCRKIDRRHAELPKKSFGKTSQRGCLFSPL